MKKITSYIIMLVVLAGLLMPVVNLEAAPQWYYEYKIGDAGSNRISAPFATEAECNAQTAGGGSIGGILFGSTVVRKCFESETTPTVTPPKETKAAIEVAKDGSDSLYDLNCGVGFWGYGGTLKGCVAGILYVFWGASAWVARLAGSFLDFFVYYSTDSKSYRNEFVEQGWGAVRDVANIFFIIALLYIAIKTILNLDGSNSKKLIVNIVVVALIINFSLFTTKVVIDASNILAKVFYNNIISKDESGGSAKGNSGEKSISVGMISKYNPQLVIGEDAYKADGGASRFIFTTLVLLAITLYTAYIFFSVALVFVSRVISLWISMIFAPLAFISYSVPFKIPGFGHEEWWDTLLKNAFLAPLFIFFLYLIVLFLKIVPELTYADNSGGFDPLQKMMSVVIPFTILFVLLSKAKKLAVEYSGEMGKAVMTAGKMVGGLALGAATGGAAMVGRRAIGGGGGYLANKLADTAEAGGFGRTATKLRDLSDFTRKSSFDARGVKIAGKGLGSVTGMSVGEANKGGWSEMKKQQVEKRQKRAAELEKRGTGKEKKAVENAEIKLKEATLPVKLDLENADRDIDKARKNLSDAKLADDGHGSNAAEIAAAKADLDRAKADKERVRTNAGLPTLEKDVHKSKHELDVASEEILTTYAVKISGNWSKNLNSIFRLGGYSRAGAEEAARKIRTGTKLDSGEKPH